MSPPNSTAPSDERPLPTPPVALQKALIAVVLTSLAVYGTIGAILFKEGWRDDLWALFFIFFIFVFTVALVTPVVYLSYRRKKERQRTRRGYLISGVLCLALALCYLADIAFSKGHFWNRFFVTTCALAWLTMSAHQFYRASKAETPPLIR
jgi:lysylphosphatidylglycerol synthetase-like protein (DUF2156 family)